MMKLFSSKAPITLLAVLPILPTNQTNQTGQTQTTQTTQTTQETIPDFGQMPTPEYLRNLEPNPLPYTVLDNVRKKFIYCKECMEKISNLPPNQITQEVVERGNMLQANVTETMIQLHEATTYGITHTITYF